MNHTFNHFRDLLNIALPLMPADRLEIVSLNCWGLAYISQHTTERINHIADVLQRSTCDIVCLQEVWQQRHWNILKSRLTSTLPYAKFYHSGIFGSGLAVLSRYPIIQTDMREYALNGRPQAFFRGDWFVGKGIASAIIQLPDNQECQIFNTHMHAPYNERVDTYLCHRTAQAWELKKLIHGSIKAGYITFATGDFNSIPGSLVHRFLTTHLHDSFITLNPELPLLPSSQDLSAQEMVDRYGVTCDVSPLNTWRATQAPSMLPKRLDYLFHDNHSIPLELNVIFTDLVQSVQCSPSDHFGIQCTYTLKPKKNHTHTKADHGMRLERDDYEEITELVNRYTIREQLHSTRRLFHFWLSFLVCVPFLLYLSYSSSPILTLFVSLGVLIVSITGVLSGLVGAIFGWWELRKLVEFGDEVELARSLASMQQILNAE